MSVEILCDENLLWSVTDGQIKLTQNGDYEMSGTWSGTLTGIGASNRKAVIIPVAGNQQI